ncbi:MAG: M24 family metallopeptidase [Alphaproteobacteria bacterium]|nr:M24 family metallopeptidase [Alphaproteobacteria bacterium]
MGFQKAFAPEEFQRRVSDVKQRMEKAGFDLLVCQDPANMGWMTGFDGWSFYTPQAVVVHQDEEWPIWFGRAQDAKSAHITTDLPAGNIIGFSEPLVHHATQHPFDELCELITARGWGTARIGVDFDAHYYTARAHHHLVSGLPDAAISDNRELVNWARLVKSPAELDYMREAGRIITDTMNNAIAKLAPGVRQYEVIADVYHDQVMGFDGNFGDYTSLCPLIQVGEGTSTPHLTWTDEPLPGSGLIVMELGAARRHYHAPLTRTMHIGPPPEQMTKLTDVILEGGDRAIEAAKPGVTCEEVEALWQSILNRNGFEKPSRVGYSIGLNYPPDWGERTASLRAGDKTVLEAGMCFHFQSGVWLDDFGAAISEPIIITEAGGECISHVARELIVL